MGGTGIGGNWDVFHIAQPHAEREEYIGFLWKKFGLVGKNLKISMGVAKHTIDRASLGGSGGNFFLTTITFVCRGVPTYYVEI